MATHYIPRNVKGEGRFLYIFSTKSLITTAIGGGVGFLFYSIFGVMGLKVAGLILLAVFAVLGFIVGTIKIPLIPTIRFTKNVAGEYIDDVIVKFVKFKMNKNRKYVYIETKEENEDGDR